MSNFKVPQRERELGSRQIISGAAAGPCLRIRLHACTVFRCARRIYVTAQDQIHPVQPSTSGWGEASALWFCRLPAVSLFFFPLEAAEVTRASQALPRPRTLDKNWEGEQGSAKF